MPRKPHSDADCGSACCPCQHAAVILALRGQPGGQLIDGLSGYAEGEVVKAGGRPGAAGIEPQVQLRVPGPRLRTLLMPRGCLRLMSARRGALCSSEPTLRQPGRSSVPREVHRDVQCTLLIHGFRSPCRCLTQ